MQVTIIGGGSYQWTPELLADLLGTASLQGAHIVLEDIDPVPLDKMEALARMVNEAAGSRRPPFDPPPTNGGPWRAPTS